MRKTTGTSPNETPRVMKPDQATLYVLSDAPPGDPLDCVAIATPFLAPHYAEIHQVGPGQALSVRTLRRAYEPNVDRLLYDFTAPHDHSWAFSTLNDAPAAVLLGSFNPIAPIAALANLRSAQRYATGGHKFPPTATVAALDTIPTQVVAQSLTRPAATITHSADMSDLVFAVALDAVETAYAALRGLRTCAAPLTVLAASRRDANDLSDIIAAFGMPAAHVRYVRNRAGLVTTMVGAGGLIDITEGRRALGDAAFVAGCIGAPVLSVTTPRKAGEAALAFAQSYPCRNQNNAKKFAATRLVTGFTTDLFALIETGFTHAQQPVVAA